MPGVDRSVTIAGAKIRLSHFAVAVAVLSVPALAGEWKLKFSSTSSVGVTDNVDLEAFNRDAALITRSAYNLDLLDKGRTYELQFAPTLGVQRNFFTNQVDAASYLPSASLDFRKSTKLTNYDIHASFARTDATANDLLQGLTTTNEGSQYTYNLGANLSHKVDRLNSIDWSNSLTLVDFSRSSADFVPYLDLTSTVAWHHQWTQFTNTNFLTGIEYYNPDSTVNNNALAYRASTGVNSKLSRRLAVAASVGVVLWDETGEKLSVRPTFNVSADYKLKRTAYSLSAGMDIAPNNDGTLSELFRSNVNISHQINDLLSASLAAGYSMQVSSDMQDESVFTVTPALNYQLSQDWTSGLSYQYVRSNNVDLSYSNSVYFTLSYGTLLMP